MLEHILLKSRGKINLTLDVLGKREDGYHEIETIMQSVYLYDTVFLKKLKEDEIKIETNLPYLPTDNKNIVYKTIELIKNKYSVDFGVYADIVKSIPVAAGMAGGSSNAAVTILGLNKIFDLNMTFDEMLKLGATLGADVPFCLYEGTAKAAGIGEKISVLSSHPFVYILLVTPSINISTKTVFESLDLSGMKKRPNNELVIEGIENKNLKMITDNFCNVLETVTEKNHPIISDLKETLNKNNALNSAMSGSGPTVFAYFKRREDAVSAAKHIKKNFDCIRNIIITRTYNPKKRIDDIG